jgi:hypothetical protein
MTDLGPLHHFLDINVSRTSSTLFLSQRQYFLDLLSRAGMSDCQPCRTPAKLGSKLSADDDPISDPTFYHSALQHATLTCPDIFYSVQQACLYMHDPCARHLAHVKHILWYLKGTLDHGLLINSSPPRSLTVQTGLVVLILGDPHLDFVFIWVIMLFLGLLKGRLQFPGLLQRLNTELSHMMSLRPCGFVNFLLNSINLSTGLQLFIVTIFLQFT